MSLELKKIALVTGGSGYLGSVIARKLAQQGLLIVIVYNTTRVEQVEELLATLPGSGHTSYFCDLSIHGDVVTLIDRIEKEIGPIFLCVHAAAQKPIRKKMYLTTEIEMQNQLQGTFIPAFNILSLVAKKMKTRKEGVLIGVTTIGVLATKEAHSLGGYIPAKFAVQGVLSSLYTELQGSGIHVHSVAPGFMEGGMNNDIPKSFIEIIKKKTKNNKLTTPEDVADVVVTLSLPNNKYLEILTIPLTDEYN